MYTKSNTMKSIITFLAGLLLISPMLVVAQEAEYDDMYFRSKDRPVLTATRATKELQRQTSINEATQQMETATVINPTDSYSARNVNPEYLSQTKVDPNASTEPSPYFSSDFLPVNVNQNLSSTTPSYSSNCMSCYSPGWNSFYPSMGFGMGGYGSPYSGFYSPYSSMYDPYGYNSFNQPGWSWSMGLSMMWGSGGYYGMNPWGMGMYNGYSSYYPGYGYGYGNGFGYGPTVIVADNARPVAYRKRVSRSSDVDNVVAYTNRTATSQSGNLDSPGRNRSTSGRTSGTDANNYYQRGWRTNPDIATTRSSWSNSERTGNDNSFSNSNSRSNNSWFNDSSSSRNSSWSGGNSSYSSGGGSRSSGASTVGGSSGSRRGRD